MSWSQSGFPGCDQFFISLPLPNMNTEDQPVKISVPVIKEELQLDKNLVETGRVKLIKKVTEKLTDYSIPLNIETVIVERFPLNKLIDGPRETRYEGDTTIIPVIKEEWVLQKQLVLVEEIHITRHRQETLASGQILLKEESIEVVRSSFQEEA